MRIYLAGNVGDEKWRDYDVAILESFYYVTPEMEKKIPLFKHFLLDSGAFTFMMGSQKIDWEAYTQRYIDFINRTRVDRFFEMDIDSIIGYDGVLKLRRKIERETGKQVIPVWHTNRGKDEFIRMCDEYGYVSIGSGETKGNAGLPWFISTAHRHGAKIHGLGFTALTKLETCHFDSVDSTAWTTGNRFGYIYRFDGRTMRHIPVPKGKRLVTNVVAQNNFNEWVKFQKYAINHL